MVLLAAKCTQCGANVEVDNTKEAEICKYCGNAFITRKAINNYYSFNDIVGKKSETLHGDQDFEIVAGKLIKYKGKNVNVIVPPDVTVIGKDSFARTNIKTVYISESVKEIESGNPLIDACFRTINFDNGAFAGCKYLQEVVMADGVIKLGSNSFWGCSNLKRVVLSNNIEIIEQGTFQGCKLLSEINIPQCLKQIKSNRFRDSETDEIQYNSGAFAGFDRLKIELPDTVMV